MKYKELIAVAVALTTQCLYCVEIHTNNAKKAGATEQELAETTLVAAALRAGLLTAGRGRACDLPQIGLDALPRIPSYRPLQVGETANGNVTGSVHTLGPAPSASPAIEPSAPQTP